MLKRGPGASLSLPVVRVLLQAEGIDALDVSPAGLLTRPGGQDPGGDIAQLKPVAEEEVEILGDLEREQVTRMAQQGPLQRAGSGLPVTVDPVPGGAHVMGLPLAHDGLIELLQDLAGGGDPLGRGRVELKVGAVDVTEHQAVIGGQILDGLVEQRHRVGAGGPDGNTPAIRECLAHLGSSCHLGPGVDRSTSRVRSCPPALSVPERTAWCFSWPAD